MFPGQIGGLGRGKERIFPASRNRRDVGFRHFPLWSSTGTSPEQHFGGRPKEETPPEDLAVQPIHGRSICTNEEKQVFEEPYKATVLIKRDYCSVGDLYY